MGGRRHMKKGLPSPLYVESKTEIEPPVGPEIETEPPAVEPASVVETEPVEPEPSIEPPVGPEIEIETEPPTVEPEPVVETEPVEHEPSIEPEPLVESNESNEFEDSDYNSFVRSESVTSEFDDSDFSVEDMSQFHVDAGIDFEGNVRVPPSVGKERIDNESETEWWTVKIILHGVGFWKFLLKILELTNSHYVSFMTYKQKGLVEGLPEVFPHSEHRTCVRHLYMNFKLKFTGKELKDALWKAARATYLREFEVALPEMKALSPKAHEWLVGKDPRNWSKSHFSCNSKCDMLLNNLCESFNNFILDARDKPIITMLEIIRTKIMQRIAKKKVEADKWSTILCPKIQKKLDATIESSNRPQKNRKKEADEKNDHSRKVGKKWLRMNCSKCGQSGHNVRTCKGVIGGNSQLNRISSVHPQTQPSRGRTVPKLLVKRPFGGIRIQDATTSIPSEQVPHHHRPSTQPPPITVVRMMMNSGNNSMSQPTTATSNFPTNDQ
ncbi:hypothetical protein GQ457_02G020060 [Hibiscus cannabinus]